VSNTLFAGAGTGGSILWAENGTTNTASDFTFDGMAFGWRYSGSQATSALDIQSITVTTNVPEPSTWALVVGAIAMIPFLRRRR
jgi:hypothetical protein